MIGRKTIYLICGVSGAGKSWVCQHLSNIVPYIKHDKHKNNSLNIINKTKSDVVIYEKTALISTFIKNNKQFNIIPVFVMGDFLKVKQQLLNRGGVITVGLYRRWRRMQALHVKYGGISGPSTGILKQLKVLLTKQCHGVIYKATTPNNKVYIGKTTQDIVKRAYDHKFGTTLFSKAVKKYGNAIKWEEIDSFTNYGEGNFKEQQWIRHYNSTDKAVGYNLTKGGEGGVPTIETRIKRNKAIKKALNNKETKKKLSQGALLQWKKAKNKQKKAIQASRADIRSRNKTSSISKQQWQQEEYRVKQKKAKDMYWTNEKRDKWSQLIKQRNQKQFIAVDVETNKTVGIFYNQSDAAKALNIPAHGISKVLNNKAKSTKGYFFEYILNQL